MENSLRLSLLYLLFLFIDATSLFSVAEVIIKISTFFFLYINPSNHQTMPSKDNKRRKLDDQDDVEIMIPDPSDSTINTSFTVYSDQFDVSIKQTQPKEFLLVRSEVGDFILQTFDKENHQNSDQLQLPSFCEIPFQVYLKP